MNGRGFYGYGWRGRPRWGGAGGRYRGPRPVGGALVVLVVYAIGFIVAAHLLHC